MLLEDLGVRPEALQELQDTAVEKAKLIDQSISHFKDLVVSHNLAASFRLRYILERLHGRYNMDLTSNGGTIAMDNPFWRQLRQVAMTDILRDIKHHARIPVPDSYLLVGVADEGPAYIARGYKNVFTLKEGQIFGMKIFDKTMYYLNQLPKACIHERNGDKPIWIEGTVSISRSPVAHPGDGKI